MARALTQRHRDTEVAKVRLGDVLSIKARIGWQGLTQKEHQLTGEYNLVTGTDFVDGKVDFGRCVFVSKERYDQDPYIQLRNDDILITKDGTIGKVAVVCDMPRPATLNSGVFVIRDKSNKLTVRYLYHYFLAPEFRRVVDGKLTGCTIAHLNQQVLVSLPINIPPLAEQKRIAGELDRICELKKNAEERLALMDQLVKSKFVEMFGDVTQNEKGWQVAKFGDVTDSRLGKMLDAKKQTGLHKRKYLANFNVQWFKIDTSELHEMDFDEADRKEFALKDGDLLVCEGGESGRCCVWRNQVADCYYQKALHRVRCHSDKLNPDFLSYWFLMSCVGHAFDHIIGAKATIAHLPGVKLKALDITIPPLSLQREFAAFVESVDKTKAALKETIATMETLYKERLQEYFA